MVLGRTNNSNHDFRWLDLSCLQPLIEDQFDVAPICQRDALVDSSTTNKCEATTERLTMKCLPGWAEFAGHCYQPKTEKRSWSEAKADCMINKGGHLASIHSEAEYSFVSKFLTSSFWIGGQTDYHSYGGSGSWTWSDRSVWDFTKWYSRPSNYGGQLCLASQMNMGWTGTDCASKNPYMCKI